MVSSLKPVAAGRAAVVACTLDTSTDRNGGRGFRGKRDEYCICAEEEGQMSSYAPRSRCIGKVTAYGATASLRWLVDHLHPILSGLTVGS